MDLLKEYMFNVLKLCAHSSLGFLNNPENICNTCKNIQDFIMWFFPTMQRGLLFKPQDPHCKNLWKTLIKSASNVHRTGKCPQRDITCADGHENVVGIEFSVEAAQVRATCFNFVFCISYLIVVLVPSVCNDEWQQKKYRHLWEGQ